MDYLSVQPPEILVHLLRESDAEDIPSLCKTHRALASLCSDGPLLHGILKFSLSKKSTAERSKLFWSLVDDRERNPTNKSRKVTFRQYQFIVALLTFPGQVEEKDPQGNPPTMNTNSPMIMDALLSYGAEPNYSDRYGSLILELARDRSGSITCIFQVIAYGGTLLTNVKDGKVSERDRSLIGGISSPDGFDLTLDLIKKGQFTPLLMNHTGEMSVGYVFRSGLQAYFRSLLYLQMGIDPLLPMEIDTGTLIGYWGLNPDRFSDINDNFLEFKLAWCYLDVLAKNVERDIIYSKKARAYYDSLLNPSFDDPLTLDYGQIRQLHLSGKLDLWSDDSFWSQKLVRDYPNEDYPQGSARERYLLHHVTPSILFPSGLRIPLPYMIGRGMVICAYLLGIKLKPMSVRIVGETFKKPDLNELYCFKPKGRTTNNPGNTYKELMLTEDNQTNKKTFFIPSIFCPYVMELTTLDGRYTHTLQFSEMDWFKGYLTLCILEGIDSKKHGVLKLVKLKRNEK